MKLVKIRIVTAERIVFEDEVYQATLPISGGEVTILPDHIPYIGVLKTGEVLLKKGSPTGQEISLAVSGGFVEFHGNTLTVLADMAERADEIDLTKAQEAEERAKEQMQKALDAEEYGRVTATLERELLRVRVARKHHTRHSTQGDGGI